MGWGGVERGPAERVRAACWWPSGADAEMAVASDDDLDRKIERKGAVEALGRDIGRLMEVRLQRCLALPAALPGLPAWPGR